MIIFVYIPAFNIVIKNTHPYQYLFIENNSHRHAAIAQDPYIKHVSNSQCWGIVMKEEPTSDECKKFISHPELNTIGCEYAIDYSAGHEYVFTKMYDIRLIPEIFEKFM